MVTRTLNTYSALIAHKDAVSGKPAQSTISFTTNATADKIIDRECRKAVKAQLGTKDFFTLSDYEKTEVTYYIPDEIFMEYAKVWKINGVVTDEYAKEHAKETELGEVEEG